MIARGALCRFVLAVASGITFAAASVVQAQDVNTKSNVFTIEANPFRGSVSYARVTASQWEFGIGAGFGFPQLDQTLFKRHADFVDFLHIAPFARRNINNRVALELGVRAGFADYTECSASDCWPGVYLGPSVLVSVGGRRVRVGTRLTAGTIWEGGRAAASFTSVSPLNLVLNWRW